MKTLFTRGVIGLLLLCSLQFQQAQAQETLEIDYAIPCCSPPTPKALPKVAAHKPPTPRAITIPNKSKTPNSITSIAALDSTLISHIIAVPLDSGKYLIFYPATGEEVTDHAIIRYIEHHAIRQ